MRVSALACKTNLIYSFLLSLSSLSGKKEGGRMWARSLTVLRRQFHAFWISQKGFTSLFLLSPSALCPRKMTLLWNGAKFVACRGTASSADILVVIPWKTEFTPNARSLDGLIVEGGGSERLAIWEPLLHQPPPRAPLHFAPSSRIRLLSPSRQISPPGAMRDYEIMTLVHASESRIGLFIHRVLDS